jgi:hypothetical protein
MAKQVAIVAVAQNAGAESKDNFYDQAYAVTKEVLDKAGMTRDEIGTVVSASSDIFHGGGLPEERLTSGRRIPFRPILRRHADHERTL